MTAGSAHETSTAWPIQQSTGVSGATSVSAPRKSKLGIPFIIALFFASILVGGGGTLGILYSNGRFSSSNNQTPPPVNLQATPGSGFAPTPSAGTPGSQLPTPTSFQVISSNNLGVSIKYPNGWVAGSAQTTTSGNTSIDIRPQQSLPIDFIIGRLSATNSAQISSTGDINQSNLAQIQGSQGVSNFQVVQPGSPQRTIGGVHWDEQDATFAASGVTLHFTTIAGQHNKLYYTIFFYVPDTNYKEAIQKYFQPMFDSFKFLS
jgi:hypothetical protein